MHQLTRLFSPFYLRAKLRKSMDVFGLLSGKIKSIGIFRGQRDTRINVLEVT